MLVMSKKDVKNVLQEVFTNADYVGNFYVKIVTNGSFNPNPPLFL